MPFNEANVEAQEYRVVIVTPGCFDVLVPRTNKGSQLPRVLVSWTDRPAEALQETISTEWGISVYITDYLPSNRHANCSPCVIAVVLESIPDCSLTLASLEQLAPEELNDEELAELRLRIEGKSQSVADVGRIGWIREAHAWAQQAIGEKLAGHSTVKQHNMGGGFVLFRLRALAGHCYWLKATSGPNRHEYRVTKLIADFARDALPEIVASRDDWNAWLMADVSNDLISSMSEYKSPPLPEDAARTLAKLQAAGQHRTQDLLDVGAFDQRPAMGESLSRDVFDYLGECMRLQTSQKTAPLDKGVLERTRDVYLQGCDELSRLQVPFTPLHGDLTGGNVAGFSGNCRLLDWCETYIGFPIASLHHLRMYFERTGVSERHLKEMSGNYRDEWRKWADKDLPVESLRWAPLMAAASTLYGRGDWLTDPKERERLARRSYSRTLARHMASAAHEVANRAALCA